MQLIDTPKVGKFDASAFTTYDNEADSTPTERELVEDLPAHLMPPERETENVKPTFRRGTGYLRAETAPEVEPPAVAATEPVGQDSFGAGIDSAQDSSNATDSADGKPPGKKRRRRRRRKPREAGDVVTDGSTPTTVDTPAADTNVAAAENVAPSVSQPQTPPTTEMPASTESAEATAGSSDSAEGVSGQAEGSAAGDKTQSEDGTPKKKRRRRRRKTK